MIVGYARTSTADQAAGLEAQLAELRAAGAEKLFSEQVSASATRRPQLDAALDFVREGTPSSSPSPIAWPAPCPFSCSSSSGCARAG